MNNYTLRRTNEEIVEMIEKAIDLHMQFAAYPNEARKRWWLRKEITKWYEFCKNSHRTAVVITLSGVLESVLRLTKNEAYYQAQKENCVPRNYLQWSMWFQGVPASEVFEWYLYEDWAQAQEIV